MSDLAERLAERVERRTRELEVLRAAAAEDGASVDNSAGDRIAALEAQLIALDEDRAAALDRELVALDEQREIAEQRVATAIDAHQASLATLEEADAACAVARTAHRAAEHSAEQARRDAARVGAALARANQFLRSAADDGTRGGGRALADDLDVTSGYELAVSAALGARLSATIVETREDGARVLDAASADGGRALVLGGAAPAGAGSAPVARGDAADGGARR